MGEKNRKNNGQEGGESKKKENGGGKNGNITVVLKADLHCEGCVSKVLKCIRHFDGVEAVNIGDGQKITVVGKMDPAKLRERVEQKTHKKVEVISPQLKKDEKAKGKENNGGVNAKQEKKESNDKNSKKKSDEKKSKEKELPITTAVLKLHLHCEGCTQKIQKIIAKTKGYQDMKIDKEKELVTVSGAIDMKALAEMLKKHLKREVQILPPKKEAEKKEKENAGGEKAKGGGGGKAKNSGGGSGDSGEKAEKMEGSRVQFQVGHPYPFVYGSGVGIDQFYHNPYAFGPHYVHAPQIFSDENPNACSVM